MAERRPAGYPKLKNYKPSNFMLPTSHYDKAKADRAVNEKIKADDGNEVYRQLWKCRILSGAFRRGWK